jgi:hypothetical protein
MSSRGILIGNIIDNLSDIKTRIQTRNAHGLTDDAKLLELFLSELLNILFNSKFENLNKKSNNPSLDLGDKSMQFAFQITTQLKNHKNKIVSCLENAIKNNYHINYKQIFIFVYGEKENLTEKSIDEIKNNYHFFKIDTNFVDLDWFIKQIFDLNLIKINEVNEIVKKECIKIITTLEDKINVNIQSEKNYLDDIEINKNPFPQKLNIVENDGEESDYDEFKKIFNNLETFNSSDRSKLATILYHIITNNNKINFDKLKSHFGIEDRDKFYEFLQNFLDDNYISMEDDFDIHDVVYKVISISNDHLSWIMPKDEIDDKREFLNNIIVKLDWSKL